MTVMMLPAGPAGPAAGFVAILRKNVWKKRSGGCSMEGKHSLIFIYPVGRYEF